MISYFLTNSQNRYNASVNKGFKVYQGDHGLILKQILLSNVWSPIVWQEGIRREAKFLKAEYVALDIEDPEISLEEVKRSICDSWHILGTTRHHRIAKKGLPAIDRMRLLLKLEKPIDNLNDYKYFMTKLIRRTNADPSGADGARLFFPCSEIVSTNFDEDAYVEEVPDFKTERLKLEKSRERQFALKRSYGAIPDWTKYWLTHEIAEGKRNTFCYGIGKDLARYGYDYERAVSLLLESPTYSGKTINPRLLKEIRDAVKRGFVGVNGKSPEGV